MCHSRTTSVGEVCASEAQLPLESSRLQRLSLLEALNILDRTTVLPSVENFICIIQKCRQNKDLVFAKRVHAHICNNGLEAHRALGNYVVPMFVECGSLPHALQVFDRLVYRNEHSWTSLLLGYIQIGQLQHALGMYQKMQDANVYPTSFTVVPLLKACAQLKDLERGRQIHVEIAQNGLEREIVVGSTLVNMYGKCGSISEAQEVFVKLPDQDVVTWNALIAGYAEHGPAQEALKYFEQMQVEGVSPDAVTFISTLKACGSIEAINKGQEIHTEISQKGLERYPLVGNTLVDMYAKCGFLPAALEVFDKLPVQDVVSWNALMAGYAKHGLGWEALKCLKQMQLENVSPNAVTFVCLLKACCSLGAIDKLRVIHKEISQSKFERDPFVGSTLVAVYAKGGSLSEAEVVFDKLLVRQIVSWTALIAGYAEHGHGQEALKCFEQLQLEGVCPNAVTYVCVLKACGSIGALATGKQIHEEIRQKGFETDSLLGNALVDMYAKCGSLSDAQEAFHKLPVREVVSWTALIGGYAMSHEENMALQCFEDMQKHGVKPNAVTFMCVLTACCHASLVLRGREYFKLMVEQYGITPTTDHYTCMVDLLARSGHLHEAEKILESMPYPLSEGTLRALLSGCKTHGEAELGLRCFQRLVEMNPDNASSYVLMADTYASAGRWDNAYRLHELRKHAGAMKKPASALIELNKKVHKFVVGDSRSLEILAFVQTWHSRMKEEGHVPNLDLVL